MIFILRTDAHKAHCLETIANLQGVWEVEVREYRKRRSNTANARYWCSVVTPVANYTGHTPEEIHEILKQEFCPAKALEINGKTKQIRSTRLLSTQEFNDYTLRCEAWAAGEGIPLA